jgi:hypothetical protein
MLRRITIGLRRENNALRYEDDEELIVLSLLLSHHKKNVKKNATKTLEAVEAFSSSRAAKSERSFVASQKSHP